MKYYSGGFTGDRVYVSEKMKSIMGKIKTCNNYWGKSAEEMLQSYSDGVFCFLFFF